MSYCSWHYYLCFPRYYHEPVTRGLDMKPPTLLEVLLHCNSTVFSHKIRLPRLTCSTGHTLNTLLKTTRTTQQTPPVPLFAWVSSSPTSSFLGRSTELLEPEIGVTLRYLPEIGLPTSLFECKIFLERPTSLLPPYFCPLRSRVCGTSSDEAYRPLPSTSFHLTNLYVTTTLEKGLK